MKTAKERELEFRRDLRDLLMKYDAELEVDTEGQYDDKSGVVTVVIPGTIRHNSDLNEPYTEFKIRPYDNLLEVDE